MRNVEPGFRVVGSDGKEIGTIANCARQYCEVNTGILGLGHTLYVPMDAINQTEGNSVFLNVSSDCVDEQGWTQPPAGASEACASGYYGTMPAEPPVPSAPPPPGANRTGPENAATPSVNEVTPVALDSVGHGWAVICSEGKQVGTVTTTRPDGLIMERGWLIFRHRVFVSAQSIARIDDVHHRVYLAIDCARVNQLRQV